jgi:hypothetical protein
MESTHSLAPVLWDHEPREWIPQRFKEDKDCASIFVFPESLGRFIEKGKDAPR